MRMLGVGRGLRIGVALLALPALCPAARGDDAPAAARRAWIGVSTRGLTDEWREREEYWARGVMVVEVVRGSAADQAGMGPGDVLVSIDSHTLQNPTDLAEAEAAMEPGRAVPVVLAREGGHMIKIFNLEPGTVPAAEAVPPPPVTRPEAEIATPETAAAPPAPAEGHLNGAAELGVRCENLSYDMAEALGTVEGQGVLVLNVTSGSPADGAGIRAGDVISWVGGQPVADVDRLEHAVATASSPVTIVTRRAQTTRNATAEFAALATTESPGGTAAAATASRTLELPGDALVLALQDEVRNLHDEVQKLRAELAAFVRASAVRQK